jgi:hypothetical protein
MPFTQSDRDTVKTLYKQGARRVRHVFAPRRVAIRYWAGIKEEDDAKDDQVQ